MFACPASTASIRTRHQSDQIHGIREWEGFIKVVYAPHQSAFDVTPRSKILDVQIADREHAWRIVQRRTFFRPQLHPTVKRSTKEWKDFSRHPLVL